jgi:hypothetical protein
MASSIASTRSRPAAGILARNGLPFIVASPPGLARAAT